MGDCRQIIGNGGFTFCGIPVKDVGLEYVPDNANTYVYRPSDYKPHEETFEAHDGGYFYGTTVNPKDFILRCVFEDQDIRDGIMYKIYETFKRGRTGKLVFDKRPWLWYIATVIGIDDSQLVNNRNGLVTIKMRAYYPFARTDYDTITEAPIEYRDDMKKNGNFLPEGGFYPPKDIVETYGNIMGFSTFSLYNAGTETAKCAIQIAGEAPDGVTIANNTTGQKCVFKALTKAKTTSVDKYIVCDSMNGKTILTNGSNFKQYAALYHDNGFIDIAPGYNVIVVTEGGTSNMDITMLKFDYRNTFA